MIINVSMINRKLTAAKLCKWEVNDKPFCKTAVSKKNCKKSRLTCITKHVIRSSSSFRFSFSVDKNNKRHHSQT